MQGSKQLLRFCSLRHFNVREQFNTCNNDSIMTNSYAPLHPDACDVTEMMSFLNRKMLTGFPCEMNLATANKATTRYKRKSYVILIDQRKKVEKLWQAKKTNFSRCSLMLCWGKKKRLSLLSPSSDTSKSSRHYGAICGIPLLAFSGRACFKSQTRRGVNDAVAKLGIALCSLVTNKKL